ncbi:hypothetical protein CEXT_66921 [Caerostris extrusa]|uniref:Uncharacterized protein n=1 Tax=Caerostris extrusa TaxID=172846 RepID=A0AAV4RMY9_CAEEX|nr:hypothetical protein CEXT_66921 [Caerostris extrusa]
MAAILLGSGGSSTNGNAFQKCDLPQFSSVLGAHSLQAVLMEAVWKKNTLGRLLLSAFPHTTSTPIKIHSSHRQKIFHAKKQQQPSRNTWRDIAGKWRVLDKWECFPEVRFVAILFSFLGPIPCRLFLWKQFVPIVRKYSMLRNNSNPLEIHGRDIAGSRGSPTNGNAFQKRDLPQFSLVFGAHSLQAVFMEAVWQMHAG